jgi:hypothetical protein
MNSSGCSDPIRADVPVSSQKIPVIAAISFLFSNIGHQSSRAQEELMLSTQILKKFVTIVMNIERPRRSKNGTAARLCRFLCGKIQMNGIFNAIA